MLFDSPAVKLLKAYYAEIDSDHSSKSKKPADSAAGRAILEADARTQIAVLRASLTSSPRYYYTYYTLLIQLCKRTLPYTNKDIQDILRGLASVQNMYLHPVQALLRSLARPLADPDTLVACLPDLERLHTAASAWRESLEKRKFLKLLDDIRAGQPDDPLPIRPDMWGSYVLTLLNKMDDELYARWLTLLTHCGTASSSNPTTKWLARAHTLVEKVGRENFYRLANAWIGAFPRKPGVKLDEDNASLIKGLAWCCFDAQDASLANTLGDVAIEGYRKVPGAGPRSAKVAGACVYALKSMPGLYGVAQLERVRMHVKQASYLSVLEKALNEAARNNGMTREELEELTIPTFDLEQGHLSLSIGPASVEIQVVGANAQVHWFNEAGSPYKSVPAALKRDHKDEIKDLKKLSDDIAHMLIAQRDRLERLPLTERHWQLSAWRERYLNHPLVGNIARRLIWHFADGERNLAGCWLDGRLVDQNDSELALSEATVVTAWHPALESAGDVLAWRNWLERHEITQPFKQAHREIYLLTDAERETNTYSNRFAAHILRQHQFNALAAARGWQNTLRLMVDASYPPTSLTLPHWNLRAEFWIEGVGEEYGVDTNSSGTYLYIATDQVRFYTLDWPKHYAHAYGGGYMSWPQQHAESALPLTQIPPIVFSEVMRDVDLFVGVASVGNDPMWQDGGPNGAYRDYWQSYGFGELSTSAETRKQLLARLIPRLAIADRSTLSGRYLVVRGDLRTYKIHLTSGNVLMEPNDQYLCIVPKQSQAAPESSQIFLPFEGDTMLAIILSKAFLLADDTHIKDPSIISQIQSAQHSNVT